MTFMSFRLLSWLWVPCSKSIHLGHIVIINMQNMHKSIYLGHDIEFCSNQIEIKNLFNYIIG